MMMMTKMILIKKQKFGQKYNGLKLIKNIFTNILSVKSKRMINFNLIKLKLGEAIEKVRE